ncbi:MAG TPA: family 16 glycosylhydrolase [Roseimicrobium sp.]|nr:family 16 glycosylhydrolase [Roseimicrobium sp.]
MNNSKLPPLSNHRSTAVAAFVALGLFHIVSGVSHAAPPAGNWTPVWTDDFNGTSLDTTKWNTGMRWADVINDELQGYSPQNVSVANGVCTLKVEKRTTPNVSYNGYSTGSQAYASGAIETYNKFTQTYGYIEARVKMATGPGTWPAFWLLPDRGASVTPLDNRVGVGTRGGVVAMGNEIDIFEYMATWKNQSTGLSKSHSGYFWDYSGGSSGTYTMVNQLVSPDTQFHTYGVAWGPGKLVYYIDGTAVATRYGRSTVATCPEYLILNCALSTNDWTGTTLTTAQIDAGLPCKMEIDYVQVYSGTPAAVPIVNGIYETEAIASATSSKTLSVAYDATYASNGAFEGLAATAVGDYATYMVPVAAAGTYNVKVRFKRAALSTSNRGQFQLSVDGVNQGAVQDEYGSGVFVEPDLGNVSFSSAGNKAFKFTVVGKNAASVGYNINFDSIKLTPVSTLPSPWVNQDVGAVGVAGNSNYASGTFTINASGANIAGTADAFQYAYQTATGDCSIIAKVESIVRTDYNAKAGVMMRQSLTDAGSPHAFAFIPNLNKASLFTRSTSGGATTSTSLAGIIHPPNWVKLTRVGNVFTGYFSTDGVTWTLIGSQTVVMPSTIYLGLAATSCVNTQLTTAVVSNVTAVP